MIGGPIGLKEVERTLKGFSINKSPGLDSFTMDSYLHFFYMLGLEMVVAIEETRVTRRILDSLKTTFPTLIPKVDRPSSIAEYRPIAL